MAGSTRPQILRDYFGSVGYSTANRAKLHQVASDHRKAPRDPKRFNTAPAKGANIPQNDTKNDN
jgi:hypothetical protein